LNIDIRKYKTIVFDCDGVILNSNRTKIDAYFSVAKRMGGTDKEAQAFVDYHVKLGSFPRNGKIEYYLKEIVKQPNTAETMQQYLQAFDDILVKTLMECEIALGLDVLKTQTPHARWMVLSGGDQVGLREILARRHLAPLFEAGIFGGPDTKDIVLEREKFNGNIQFPALFIGDSKYDYQSSTKAGLDFVFLSDWTEVQDWQAFCTENNIQSRNNIQSLI
jgi:phosphoglycolate phosphatase-like HAD superfamily hydrolase